MLLCACVHVCVHPGKSPSQQFTALIHAVTPLQSQVSPAVKLIIAVAKSKFCAQVGIPPTPLPFSPSWLIKRIKPVTQHVRKAAIHSLWVWFLGKLVASTQLRRKAASNRIGHWCCQKNNHSFGGGGKVPKYYWNDFIHTLPSLQHICWTRYPQYSAHWGKTTSGVVTCAVASHRTPACHLCVLSSLALQSCLRTQSASSLAL